MNANNQLRTNLERRKPPIRILIADNHSMARNGLRDLLSIEDDFVVVGEAVDGSEVVNKVQQLQPDVLLLDLRMPSLDSRSMLQAMAHLNKHTRVILLTDSEENNGFGHNGKPAGIVMKHSAGDSIVKSIRKVQEIWSDSDGIAPELRQLPAPIEFAATAAPVRPRGRSNSALTAREREIVHFVAQGYKNKEMAEKMFISEQTVKNHLHNIFDKLGVSDRFKLAVYAIHQGFHTDSPT